MVEIIEKWETMPILDAMGRYDYEKLALKVKETLQKNGMSTNITFWNIAHSDIPKKWIVEVTLNGITKQTIIYTEV